MRNHGGDLLPSFCYSKATFKWNEVRSSTFLSCFHSTRNVELNFLQSPFETTYKAATFERASAATAAATAITAPRWRSQFSTKPGRNSKQQETERKKASACDSQWISSLTGTQSRGKWVLKSFLNFHVMSFIRWWFQAAITIGIIMGVFLLCWMPFFIINVVAGFCKDCISVTTFKVP